MCNENERGLNLKLTGFKFFVKMAKIKGCRNLKTDFETKPT